LRSGAYPNSKQPGLPTRAAGHLCVTVLRVLQRLPLPFAETALGLILPVYPLLRPSQTRRLRAAFAAFPHPDRPGIRAYYRMRLGLLLRGLRLHGNSIPPASVRIIGGENYRMALECGRPVALLGLHAGMLELLHRIPEAPKGRPFLILTAPAFSPALSAFMAKGRERDGKRVLWNRKPVGPSNPSGLEFTHGLRSVLKSNGVLALMADQLPGVPVSETLELWDRIRLPYPARLLGFLVRKGFLIVPVSTTLLPDGTSDFRFHQAFDPEEAKDAAYLRSHTRLHLEAGITAAPDQWNWSYPKVHAL
jgi:lauroyl/myristoyl acyltransferase